MPIRIALFGAVLAALVYGGSWLLFGFEWNPDRRSPYAERAHSIDAQLKTGMTLAQVRRLYRDDIRAFPNDFGNREAITNERRISADLELSILEPPARPFAYGTLWSVHSIFSGNSLVAHRVEVAQCCGL